MAMGFGLAACVFGPSTLPTHRDLGEEQLAVLDGTLVVANGCLFAQGTQGQGRWLVIWPSGFSLRGDLVVDGRGHPKATVGQPVRLLGREYNESQYAFLRTLMEREIPNACREADYWLAIRVIRDVRAEDQRGTLVAAADEARERYVPARPTSSVAACELKVESWLPS